MEISVSLEMYIFLMTVLLGAVGGMLFDLTRIYRSVFGGGFVLTGILDFIFWIVFGALAFGLLFYVNSGELRLYELLGVILGALMYFLALSAPFRWISERILRICVKFLAIIFKILLTPIIFLYKMMNRWMQPGIRLLKKPFYAVRRSGKRLFSRIGFKIKNIFKAATKD